MKISEINKNITFKSIRTDKNTISTLKTGTLPIVENKKENILTALNNLQNSPSRNNIEFLIDIADNLAYGQGENTEFKRILDIDGVTPTERENTPWALILEDTIKKSLETSTEDTEDLQKIAERIFNTEKELTPEQENLLNYRKELTNLILSSDTENDVDTFERKAIVRENIDYFIASSEIPLIQKEECLKKFISILNKEYEITPQLEDKRLQIMDEMLNDMLIKTPKSDILTIKDVNQRHSGICAAISICRKALAYEDKVQYMDTVMDELSNSPYMSVYDITELGTGKKVEIEKIQIDYDAAIEEGYRIIDASAHNWMQNAHTAGDGTIVNEQFEVFDREHYGINHDTSWYEGLDSSLDKQKTLLKFLIQENNFLEGIEKRKKSIKETKENLANIKNRAIDTQTKINGELHAIFSEIYPDKTTSKISKLIKKTISFYKGSKENTNEKNITQQMSEETRLSLLKDFIEKSTNETNNIKLESKLNQILDLTNLYVSAENDIKKLGKFNKKRSKYDYYKRLFKVATAHHFATKAAIEAPFGTNRFEKMSGLPPRDIQIINYIKSQKTENKEQQILDLLKIEATMPKDLDLICNDLFGYSTDKLLIDIFENLLNVINAGNKELIDSIANQLGVEKDKTAVIKNINKWLEQLETNPTDTLIQEATRAIGYENRLQLITSFFASLVNSFANGMPEEQFNEFLERFGSKENIAKTIEQIGYKLDNIREEYNEIQERWNIPTTNELILKNFEKKGDIISINKLDILNARFETIRNGMIKNSNIENTKERAKANDKLFEFTETEEEILANIEKNLAKMRKFTRSEYNSLNKTLFNELENQYSKLGKLGGQYWVREEGSSGLTKNEQLRILEQMTGKQYHIQNDIYDVAKEIKEGNGSGIISYSVEDDDYGFHAQYVPHVSTLEFLNPKTKEISKKDVIWTDNSWGRAEKDNFWKDQDGRIYTDYGSGYGWKKGFLLSPKHEIGLLADDIHGAVGFVKDGKNIEKFGLYVSTLLPGSPIDAYQKLYKMFSYIINIGEGLNYYNVLENKLANGDRINPEKLDALDEIAHEYTEKIKKRIDKEIKTKEDFEKLKEDDDIKFNMNLISLYLATNNPELKDSVLELNSIEEIEEMKEDMLNEHIDTMAEIISKSDDTYDNIYATVERDFRKIFADIEEKFNVKLDKEKQDKILNDIFFDKEMNEKCNGAFNQIEVFYANRIVEIALKNIENQEVIRYFIENAQKLVQDTLDSTFKIKSLESPILANSPLGGEFIKAIDKFLTPSTDEELLKIIQGLQYSDRETISKFFELFTFEDVGLNFKDPYSLIERYKSEDSVISQAMSEVMGTKIISENVKTDPNSDNATAEELYRNLHVKLADMNVQKYVKNFKAEAFQKYKVRQAFPQPVVVTENAIKEAGNKMLDEINNFIENIENSKFVLDIFATYENLKKEVKNNEIYGKLTRCEDIQITEENEEELNDLYYSYEQLHKIVELDDSLSALSNITRNILNSLVGENGIIKGNETGNHIRILNKFFKDWNESGINKEKFLRDKNIGLKNLSTYIQGMINSNVDVPWRNDAIKKVNKFVSLTKNRASEEEIKEAEKEIETILVEKHITKNPEQLLKECINLIQENKIETPEYKVLKHYLHEALKIAQQTKIQYKLVENQHEGINSKIKDMLSLFGVAKQDGSFEHMDSDTGMVYLVNQLANANENYETLNLFLNQSGLSKRALTAVIKSYENMDIKKDVDDTLTQIYSELKNIENLTKLLRTFISQTNMNFKTLKEALTQLQIFIERKTQNEKNKDIYDKYSKYLQEIIKSDSVSSVSQQLIESMLITINEDIIEEITSNTNEKIQTLIKLAKSLDENIKFINAIDLQSDCEEQELRNKFIIDCKEIQDYIYDKHTELKEYVSESNILTLNN